jgi:tetratricopeptide (TPR) repeat protein
MLSYLRSPMRSDAGPILVALLLLSSLTADAVQIPELYAQAETLVRQDRWDEGIALLRQVLAAEPENLKAHNLMGIALSGMGDVSGAGAEFERAVRIDPRFVPALKNLAINELAQNKVGEAQRHFSSAQKIVPDDPMIQAYLGDIAYSQHRYKTAAQHLQKAGDFLRNPAAAARLAESFLETGEQTRALAALGGLDQSQIPLRQQFSLGLILARHELYAQAIPYFQAVAAKYPASYDAAFNLAVCYVETKQFPTAIETLKATAAAGHKTAELDNLLAEAYEGNQQTQEAIDTLREATRLGPQDENNYIDLAALCTTYEAYALGLEVIEVGLHYHPQSDRLIFQRGVIYAMRNQFDLAEQDFQLAAKLAPEKNLSYVALGVSYMQVGDLPKAITSLRQRIKHKPDDSTLRYLLGEALVRSGATAGDSAFAEAKASLEKSVKLNPRFAPAQVNLGKIYLKENRLDEAMAHLEQARALDPKDKSAYSQLAIVYRRKGKPEAAKTMLAKLNELNDQERQEEGHRKRLQAVEGSTSPQESAQDAKP